MFACRGAFTCHLKLELPVRRCTHPTPPFCALLGSGLGLLAQIFSRPSPDMRRWVAIPFLLWDSGVLHTACSVRTQRATASSPQRAGNATRPYSNRNCYAGLGLLSRVFDLSATTSALRLASSEKLAIAVWLARHGEGGRPADLFYSLRLYMLSHIRLYMYKLQPVGSFCE